jgi:4-hydroxybenzoyl-CoA thioesterase
MSFRTELLIRFAHVDAAGIVFYPRYFELLNGVVEDWFAAMGHDFRTLHLREGIGVPTVDLKCQFLAPSELGDALEAILDPAEPGRSSCSYDFRMTGGGVERLRGSGVLVCMDLARQRAVPWPDALRRKIQATRDG